MNTTFTNWLVKVECPSPSLTFVFHIQGFYLNLQFEKESFGPIGFGKAIQSGWIGTETKDGVTMVVRKVPNAEDSARVELKQIKEGNAENLGEKAISQLKKRKWITEMFVFISKFCMSLFQNIQSSQGYKRTKFQIDIGET